MQHLSHEQAGTRVGQILKAGSDRQLNPFPPMRVSSTLGNVQVSPLTPLYVRFHAVVVLSISICAIQICFLTFFFGSFNIKTILILGFDFSLPLEVKFVPLR